MWARDRLSTTTLVASICSAITYRSLYCGGSDGNGGGGHHPCGTTLSAVRRKEEGSLFSWSTAGPCSSQTANDDLFFLMAKRLRNRKSFGCHHSLQSLARLAQRSIRPATSTTVSTAANTSAALWAQPASATVCLVTISASH